ncbi:hypothetical protein [Corynebacterium coyleae]|uniref:hypothetical protein n=1 Tax=Corynebacterium coyleae TaxID=53374 RepID=UPI00254D626B|nr:hypothetical protein [Corynebacterium coyleae]MDK8800420.1 hypothetical protein [Corynebacterium coyleae]
MESNEWVEHFTRQMGRAIDSARGKRSDQWIADRTQLHGHPISRTAISEYRRGIRKTMPVTDWLVIAAALEVPPVSLLFPEVPNGLVTLLPNHLEVAAFDAVEWVSGERQTVPVGADVLIGMEDGDLLAMHTKIEYLQGRVEYPDPQFDLSENDPSKQVKILKLAREAAALSDRLSGQLSELWTALTQGQNRIDDLTLLIETLQRQIDNCMSQIAELGGNVEKPDPVELSDGDGEG